MWAEAAATIPKGPPPTVSRINPLARFVGVNLVSVRLNNSHQRYKSAYTVHKDTAGELVSHREVALEQEKQVTHTTRRHEQHHKQTTTRTNPPTPHGSTPPKRDQGIGLNGSSKSRIVAVFIPIVLRIVLIILIIS